MEYLPKIILSFILLPFYLIGSSNDYCKDCRIPFGMSFLNRNTQSIDLRWSDTNVNPDSWQLELLTRGTTPSGIPTIVNILTKTFTFNGLSPSTAYDLYIRVKCTDGSFSNWNGPFLFTTAFENPTNCQISVPVKDNGTDVFFIKIDEEGILGRDIFIQSIDLIMQHDWPADMQISLESPSGKIITLSNHNGTITDDFGNISDLTCMQYTSFDPNACNELKDFSPPYIGNFKPDEGFGNIEDLTTSKGLWKLITFDRAPQDAGTIKFFRINFSREKCVIPEQFIISEIGNNSVTVQWSSFEFCNAVQFSVGPVDLPADSLTKYFVNCNAANFEINQLLPNTEYQIFINAVCGTSLSASGCPLVFKTNCEPSTLSENFDRFNKCIEGCAFACEFESIWKNNKDDGIQDWIVWSGKTDTENTGPDGDINQPGNYIYIENNPEICGTLNNIILESECIQIHSNTSGCDLSFYYHMNGQDITFLSLELSTDGGNHWNRLFYAEGEQGNRWRQHTLSLAEYHNLQGVFRFVTQSAKGTFGDIALDQIDFYGSVKSGKLSRYYEDNDKDGYGSIVEYIDICSSIPPEGYVLISGDCNDNDPDIHPGQTEIQCNLIDENCNGMEDDRAETNPILYTAVISDESCLGFNDGTIELVISGGNQPYQIIWNNNDTSMQIQNLSAGFYFAQISDFGGCKTQTDFIEIKSESSINFSILNLIRPTCQGIADGEITIEHSGGQAPFKYHWSNGDTLKNPDSLSGGSYFVTITDSVGCQYISHEISLDHKPGLISELNILQSPVCFGFSDGIIKAEVINGILPYSYLWNTGQITQRIENLAAGNYAVTVTDSTGCKSVSQKALNAPSRMRTELVSIENVRCFGESSGSIKTNTTGGNPPYTYFWNNFLFTDDIFDIKAGTYNLQVNDKNGCEAYLSNIVINQPTLLNAKVDSIGTATCPKGKNGFISVSAFGGVPEYFYSWNVPDYNLNFADSLFNGKYSITVFDRNGCKTNLRNIEVPFINNPILADLKLIHENKCFEDKKASIAAQILSGTQPYDFNWSSGLQYIKSSSFDTITQLSSGLYNLTITDAEGCIGITNNLIISEVNPFFYTVKEIKNNECSEDSDGIIKLDITGGIQPVEVTWNNGLYSGNLIEALPNGKYNALITDNNLCEIVTESFEINSFSDIRISAIVTHATDNNPTGRICISINGGKEPYSILWSDLSANVMCLENLSQGEYSVTVLDGLDCKKTLSYQIDNISNTDDWYSQKIKIYPNPVSDMLNIDSEFKIKKIRIFSSNHTLIKEMITSTNVENIIIETTDFPVGFYIAELYHNEGIIRRKFIKI